ncbi:MAG: alkaline phosphatase family protein [Gemmatimonadota bacterium]
MSHRLHAPATTSPARRVVLLVLDGLRADLVGDPRFPNLAALQRESACTTDATTVLPSVTAVAMTSLLSGLSPIDHGVDSDRFRVPLPRVPMTTLPQAVAAAGFPTSGVVRQVPWLIRSTAQRIVRALGLQHVTFATANAHVLLTAAMPALRSQRTGLIVLHWPDCDAVGHGAGWMSAAYLTAVARMDHALGILRSELAATRHDTLLMALADHGGGGRVATHHDSAHPHDCTIPIFIDGAGVVPQELPPGLTLLDVPATVLHALGVAIPGTYAGTPIVQAFRAPTHARETATAA